MHAHINIRAVSEETIKTPVVDPSFINVTILYKRNSNTHVFLGIS